MSKINQKAVDKQHSEDVALIVNDTVIKGRVLARRGLRISTTKTISTYNARSSALALPEAEALYIKLTNLVKNLDDADKAITSHMIANDLYTDDQFDISFQLCESYQDELVLCLQKVKIELDVLRIPSQSASNSNQSSYNQKMSLPKMGLPVFDGAIEKYHAFITEFDQTVDKFNLSPFEKFTFLKHQLTGSVLDLVDSIPIRSRDYPTARKLLDNCYCDSDEQKAAFIEGLLSLEMDLSNPLKWLAAARTFREEVQTLKINSSYFVQYFLWRTLKDEYKQKLIEVCGKSSPSLSDIVDQFFEAHKRVLKLNGSKMGVTLNPPAATGTMALAANITSNSKHNSKPKNKSSKCVLCDEEHRASVCTKFPTPTDKIKRLNDLKICDKCMLRNHTGVNCKFKFKFKCTCGSDKHYSFLCPKANNSSKSSSTGTFTSVVASQSKASLSLSSHNSEQEVLLPSFTTRIKGDTQNSSLIRVFYDSCATHTLIESEFAKFLSLKVIESNVSITITGINSIKSFVTERVEVPIYIGNKHFNIVALCVPNIGIELQLTNLDQLVSIFKSKNYPLADQMLRGNCISDAKLLLGSDYHGILPIKSYSFGDGKGEMCSCYWHTPLGVMLLGCLSKLLEDSKHLNAYVPNTD